MSSIVAGEDKSTEPPYGLSFRMVTYKLELLLKSLIAIAVSTGK